MFLHEIGFLIVDSAFKCWLVGSVMTCPNEKRIKPANVMVEEVSNYVQREVHYEISGLKVFAKTKNGYEIKKENGQTISVPFTEVVDLTKITISEKIKGSDIRQNWYFESLEDVLKSGMITHGRDLFSLIKKDDLITPADISKESIEQIRKEKADKVLGKYNQSLPVGFIVVKAACTYKKLQGSQLERSCMVAQGIDAYKTPDKKIKVSSISMTQKFLEGRMRMVTSSTPAEKTDDFPIYDEKGDWVQLKVPIKSNADGFFDEVEKNRKADRNIWINKKDIPYEIVKLEPKDRLKTLLEFSTRGFYYSTTPNTNISLSADRGELERLEERSPSIEIQPVGEFKWKDGILWVKVSVVTGEFCTGDEHETIGTGWVPYIDPATKKQFLGWYSRGC